MIVTKLRFSKYIKKKKSFFQSKKGKLSDLFMFPSDDKWFWLRSLHVTNDHIQLVSIFLSIFSVDLIRWFKFFTKPLKEHFFQGSNFEVAQNIVIYKN